MAAAVPPLGLPSPADLSALASYYAFANYYARHNYDPFASSIDAGVKGTVYEIDTVVSRCKRAELILSGYSHGAMVMHQAEWKLSGSAIRHIRGTLLIADGDRTEGAQAALTLGSARAGGKGVRTWFATETAARALMPFISFQPRGVRMSKTTVSICNSDDIVCDFSLAPKFSVDGQDPVTAVKNSGIGKYVGSVEVNFADAMHVHMDYKSVANTKLLAKAADFVARGI